MPSLTAPLPHPYYIYCPDYRDDSSGIRVLHLLCHALNLAGQEAYVTANTVAARLRTPRLTPEVEQWHRQAGRIAITVYPEVVSGNPRNAPIVVRYLLNTPGYLAGDKTFAEAELLFAYDQEFVPPGMRAESLFLPPCDLALFNPFGVKDENRKGTYFFVHRYLKNGGQLLETTRDSVELSYRHPRTLAELAAIFRSAELLYSYERSALCLEAMLCGCPVVYLPNEGLTRLPGEAFFGRNGTAWGTDPAEIGRARATVGQIYPMYLDLEKPFWNQLEQFIQLTQEAALNLQSTQRPENQVGGGASVTNVMAPAQADVSYLLWQATHGWGEVERCWARETVTDWSTTPSFHWAVIVTEGAEEALLRTWKSLVAQCVGVAWNLTAVSTAPRPAKPAIPAGLAWRQSARPLQTVNELLSGSESDWVGLLEAGDGLPEHALFTLAFQTLAHPVWQVLYTDEDSLDADGGCSLPYFKPDFSPDLVRAAPFAVGGLLLLRREAFAALGGLRPEMEGVEYYDLVLRASERLGPAAIGHIQDVLYHRFVAGGHGTRSPEEAAAAGMAALHEHLERLGRPADISAGLLPGTFHIHYRHGGEDLVSIVIPTQNGGAFLQRCIGSIFENTAYPNFELIVVDRGSDDVASLDLLAELKTLAADRVRILTVGRDVILTQAANRGAAAAKGRYLLFLSDAAAALNKDWLDEMLGYAGQPDVGVVGGRLIAQDASLLHAGYLLGLESYPAVLYGKGQSMHEPGYFGRLQLPSNPSAVAAACMMVDKALFDQLGGFDAGDLLDAYSDVDLCLRAGKMGRRVVWTPHATLLHEGEARPEAPAAPDEANQEEPEPGAGTKRLWHLASPSENIMFSRWLPRIAHDPAYNRNLTLASASHAFEIELATGITWDTDWRPRPRVLGHPADRMGCGEYRIIAPMRCLANQGLIQSYESNYYLTTPGLARMSPDVVIVQRQVEWGHVACLQEYARHNQSFRIYELDDLLTNVQLQNCARKKIQSADLIKRFRKALNLCDRMVVSTDYLADEYRRYIDDVVVVPNYVERARWGGLRPLRRQSERPRVGWAGSMHHTGDFAIIVDVVKATRAEVDWIFFGMCPDEIKGLVKEFHPGVPLDDYPAKLASLNLDLAIAPLEDVPFNHGKSHLRLLEYGVLGYPVICTDITAYRGEHPVTRVKNRFKDWAEAIREQVSDRDELARRGDALRDYINANWILEDHTDVWLKAWLPA